MKELLKLFVLTLMVGLGSTFALAATTGDSDFGDLDDLKKLEELDQQQNSGDSANELEETDGMSGEDEMSGSGMDKDSSNSEDDDDLFLEWGYSSSDEIEVDSLTTGSVELSLPVVEVSGGEKIKKYKVFYSQKSIEEIDPFEMNDKSFVFDVITGDYVKAKIDDLKSGQTYYSTAIPINEEDVEGQPSEEIQYTTKEKAHKAPENVEMNSISYSYTGNTVNLTWSPVEGADKVELFIRKVSEKDFTRLGATDMSKGSYEFDFKDGGEYFVKVIPIDENMSPVGESVIQKIEVEEPKEEDKKVEKAPEVGPETNLLIFILFLAVASYLVVRYARVRR